jgi:hypothetical protein
MEGKGMKIGGHYNWKNQDDKLIYMGRNWSGNGYWHQFAKKDNPGVVWCEVLDSDLHMIEETAMTEQNKQELSTGKILSLERRSNMTDDEALRFARTVEALVNKQPPAEAGEGAVLYMARNLHSSSYATSRSKAECELFLAQSALKNDGVEGEVIALYTSQTTATQAAVAAAMRNALDSFAYILDNPQVFVEAKDWVTLAKDRAANSIPAEATAALRELMMEVVADVWQRSVGVKCRLNNVVKEDLRRIVDAYIERS